MNKYLQNHHFIYFVIILFGILPFIHTLFFYYSPLDDAVLILGRLPWLQDYRNIYAIFTEPLWAGIGNYYYRPLLILSFMMDAMTGSGSPISFHITNLLLHLISSLLIFELLKNFDIPIKWSLVGTIFFILHPVNISAISWIPGRNDPLLAVFGIASFLNWIYFNRTGEKKYFSIHILFYVLALLTKENAIVLPVLASIYYYLFQDNGRIKLRFPVFLTWIFATGIWFTIRFSVMVNPQELQLQNFSRVLMDIGIIFCMSIGKIILPIQQAIAPNLLDLNPYPAIITTAVFGLIVWKFKFKNNKIALFGFLWSAGFAALPELWVTIFKIGYSYEHRLYLPMIGFFLIISQLNFPAAFSQHSKLTTLLIIILISIFGLKAVVRSLVYQDYDNFSTALVKESPSMPFAHKFRADILARQNNFIEAEKEYIQSLALSPNQPELYFNRGNMYLAAGKDSLAVHDFRKTIELDSLHDQAYYALGLDAGKQAKIIEAVDYYTHAIHINSQDYRYYNERGFQYMKLKRISDAETDFSRSIELNPDSVVAYQNRSVCRYYLGRFSDSLLDLQQVELQGGQIVETFLDSLMLKLLNSNLEIDSGNNSDG